MRREEREAEKERMEEELVRGAGGHRARSGARGAGEGCRWRLVQDEGIRVSGLDLRQWWRLWQTASQAG
jgi:hypothetical protein